MVAVITIGSTKARRWTNIKELITGFEYSYDNPTTSTYRISLDVLLDGRHKHTMNAPYTADEIIEVIGEEAFKDFIAEYLSDHRFWSSRNQTTFRGMLSNIKLVEATKGRNYWAGIRALWNNTRRDKGLPT